MEAILEAIVRTVLAIIEQSGYGGIFILMALESANIPIPSEVIMPFAGYLVWQEQFQFLSVVLWGAMGNLLGSVISYFIGFYGGRAFIERYGKFFFVTQHDLAVADRWFKKYGAITIFASRILPVVRTFISFPAGVAKMNIWKFSLYTLAGSLIWSTILTYTGVIAGENWNVLSPYFRKFDWLIVLLLIGGGVWWIWRHIRIIQNEKFKNENK